MVLKWTLFSICLYRGLGWPLMGEEEGERERATGLFILPLPLLDIPRQKGLLI